MCLYLYQAGHLKIAAAKSVEITGALHQSVLVRTRTAREKHAWSRVMWQRVSSRLDKELHRAADVKGALTRLARGRGGGVEVF